MRLAILSGGSDSQGINAAIRSVVKAARGQFQWETFGFLRGWKGLLEGQLIPLQPENVSGVLSSGGTLLGTSATNPIRHSQGLDKIREVLRDKSIDALVVLGGRDIQKIAAGLYRENIPVTGIPCSVDNDLARTDYSIGFQSAVSVVTEAVDRLHTTASAHHRVMVLEVMGRDTGWVALYGGLGGGADWIIIPEVQPHFQDLKKHLQERVDRGKNFSIIVIAEGATLPEVPLVSIREADEFGRIRMDRRNVGHLLGRELEKSTGFEARVTVLGHLQRGGPPCAGDRILATRMGVEAVELIRQKKFGRMVTFQGNRTSSETLERVMKESPRMVPIELYNMARLFY